MGGTGIEASWAGGLHGREVIDRFLPILPHVLKKFTGVCYLVLVEDNKPDEIKGILKGDEFSGEGLHAEESSERGSTGHENRLDGPP